MIKVWKNKWIKALRSGNYQQTQSVLKEAPTYDGKPVTGFCCLGVLRDIMDPTDNTSRSGEDYFLSTAQLNACGLDHRTQKKLADFNDDDKLTFDEIANYIKKHIPGR